MNAVRRSLLGAVVCGLLLTAHGSVLGQETAFDLETTLARLGAQLERRYQQTQRIVSTEMVWVRSFTREMRSNGSARRLEFERRVEWGTSEENGVPSVTVFRDLRSVNGREPKQGDEDACLTPAATTEDPLSAFLPVRQVEFDFSLRELEQIDSRLVARLEYVPVVEGSADVTWDEDCVSISLSGRSRGEVWVDVESGDVLRLDEHLTGQFDFRVPDERALTGPRQLTLERDDRSIRYERVTFENPVETLMLPRSIERSWVFRGGGFVPRYYRRQQFSNHRRFVTDGRLVGVGGTADDGGRRQPEPAPARREP